MLSLLSRSARSLATSAPRFAAAGVPAPSALAAAAGPRHGLGATGVVRRHLSKKIVDVRRSVQRSAWSAYLSGNLSDADLFAELDLNKSGDITVTEVNYFLESVGKEGVEESKFELLQELGGDHQLDKEEFRQWLRVATDVKEGIDGAMDAKVEESSSSDSSDNDEGESAAAAPKRKVVDVRHGLQRTVWESFLETGRGASDLFKMVDLNRSSSISAKEVAYFVDSIGGKGVSQGKLNELKALGGDHELNEVEFYHWLGEATGVELADDGEVEHSSVRDDGEGCTPGQW